MVTPPKSPALPDEATRDVAATLLALVRGRTFDDFLLRPRYSVLERRDPAQIDLGARFSHRIELKCPLVSANMDTVTRAAMAVALAEEGGLGVIDRGFRRGDIEPQVREVTIVKRTQHGVIAAPYTISPDAPVGEAAARMTVSGVGTLVVVDGEGRLVGLLTDRDLRFVDPGENATVAERMTPRQRLVAHRGPIDAPGAERLMREHKIKKLPIVDDRDVLEGLLTARDLLSQREHPFATRDEQGRLRVGAAIGAKGDYLERAAELVRAGADVIVIDIAHGHSVVMARAIEAFRQACGDVELVAGNVATAEGARFLMERGVNGIKVGIGSGGGCTTRLHTNFGVPQVEALVDCRLATGGRVPLIADGGVKRHGALLQALVFGGDTVMLGSAFAGTIESPGEIVQKPVLLPENNKTVKVPFKVFRGMASLQAIVDRLDVEDADAAAIEALGAEGLEVSVPARGSVRGVIEEMLKHLCSSVSYGGASSLQELRRLFWEAPDRYLIPLSRSGRRESFER
jgi:IMP dehydrogenase